MGGRVSSSDRLVQVVLNIQLVQILKDMIKLSEELRERALQEYGETPELLSAKLEDLRMRLRAHISQTDISHGIELCPEDLSESNLVRFLRGRKLDVDLAFSTVLNWATFRRDHPDYFIGLSSREFQRMSKFYRVLPEPDKLGRLVCIFPGKRCLQALDNAYLESNPLAIVRGHVWFTDRISRDPRAQVCGIVAILSFANIDVWDQLRLAQILKINEQLTLVHYFQNCIGLRLKSVSFFDEPSFISYLWYFIKPLLTEKMSKRFGFYGTNYDVLFDIVPSYGGGGLEECEYDWVGAQIIMEESDSDGKRNETSVSLTAEENFSTSAGVAVESHIANFTTIDNNDGRVEL